MFFCVVLMLCRPNSAFALAVHNAICHLQGQLGSPVYGTIISRAGKFGNPCSSTWRYKISWQWKVLSFKWKFLNQFQSNQITKIPIDTVNLWLLGPYSGCHVCQVGNPATTSVQSCFSFLQDVEAFSVKQRWSAATYTNSSTVLKYNFEIVVLHVSISFVSYLKLPFHNM